MDMAIAAAATDMAANRVMSQVNLTMIGKTKDMAEQSAQEMINTMVPPAPRAGAIGSAVDIRV